VRKGWLLFSEEDINLAAYHLMRAQKTKEAVDVFTWNTELFPASGNAWDSLAEGLEADGQHVAAMAASEECLRRIPAQGTSHHEMLRKVSHERIERLKVKQ
jgi:hypothetical protein